MVRPCGALVSARLAILWIAGPGLALAQAPGSGRMLPQLPSTPAGRETAALLADFNAGRLQQPRWIRWRQVVGPVTVRGVEELPQGGLRAWVQGSVSRAWLGWEVTVAPDGRVDRARIPVFWLGGTAPQALRPTRAVTVDPELAAPMVLAYLVHVADEDLFSGVVILAHRGRPIVRQAIGYANKVYGARNTVDTRFPIASVGKVFTAVAVARLVAADKLSFAATIGSYLPDYPIDSAKAVTVGQLLAHTSGLGRSPVDWIAMREQITLDDLVRYVAAPLSFPPGSSVEYSNEAFLVAGRIVERASGLPYEDFVRREVFAPAGMRDTDWDPIDEASSRRAVPYSNWRFVHDSGQIYVPGPRRDVTYLQGRRGTPAGGAFTTAEDLLRFATALVERRLIDSATTAALFAPRARRPGGHFTYGFELNERGTIASKAGGAQGSSAQVDISLDGGYTLIVLSNYDSAAQVVAAAIRDVLKMQ